MIPVVMPRLGWNMEAGTVVQWLKHEGDPVRAGEMLLLVESDKATTEVESLDSGILRFPPDAPEIGAEYPVGTVLAYLVQDGEDLPDQGTGESPVAGRRSPDSDQRRGARPGHPPGGAPSPTPQRAGQPAASPRAIRIAGELGVDWTALTGTGMGGRIVERDVRAAAERQAAPAAVPAAVAPPPPAAAREASSLPSDIVPLSATRRTIGARLAASAQTAAAVTLTTEADAAALVRLHAEIAAAMDGGETPPPTLTALVARLVAVALTDHPDLNASLDGDHIIRHDAVHLGIAVETERGLLVPVVRDAQAKSVRDIAAESARLVAAARAGSATREELTGGTFTITNLGMYEIDAFTPIINPPEVAILGVGRVVAKPVVDEGAGTVGVGKAVALSLTFDHRAADGAPAARFLRQVKRFIERPVLWLTR